MDDRCFCKANHGFEGSRGRSSDLRRGWGVGVGGVAPTYGLIDMCGALYQNLVQTTEAPWPGTRASAWVIISIRSLQAMTTSAGTATPAKLYETVSVSLILPNARWRVTGTAGSH